MGNSIFDRMLDRAVNVGTRVVHALRRIDEQRWAQADRVPFSPQTLAGVTMTPDSAVTIPAAWACLRYLSQTVAVPPWHVLSKSERGPEIQTLHPVDWLLSREPNEETSSLQFRETLTHWALRWGNGYAEIERNSVGNPIALWPIHPDRVRVCRDANTLKLYYEVSTGSGPRMRIEPDCMFHIRGFGEGPVGVNVLAYAAQSLGWVKAAQLFGASFFGNGMNLGGVVVNKNALKPAGLRRQKEEFSQLYKGPHRGNKWAHIDNDADVKPFAIEPNKAQFIETQQHLVEETCRWFGVPPHKVMHLLRATFSNIEHQAIEVVQDSILPWARRFEDEANKKLFGQNRRSLYSKINLNGLMRGDTVSRMEWYKGMVSIGAFSPNRVLELEDEHSIGPDGDIHVMQSQWTTLERIRRGDGAA